MNRASTLPRSCCGVRAFADEDRALRALERIALLVSSGKPGTWSEVTGIYECRAGFWHLRECSPELGFSAEVLAQIRHRAGGHCEPCGAWVGTGGQCHHRANRQMGGSRHRNTVQNGGLLCGTPFTGCHGLATRLDREMREAGWVLGSGQDPALAAVLVASADGGVRKWLTASGGYGDEAPGRAA